jgi:outer membrane protein assembly factor BamE (lipoprotein component of BamABCDE complex)
MNRCFAVLAAAALSACSSYGPGSLSKDASVESTLQAMGPPTADITLPNGERRLEYARGPYGKHTYMLDFDAQGRLLRWDQVLTESRFNAIQAGMTANDVLAQIGHASETYYIGWQKQNVWAYRYESPFCVWFQVGLDQQGKVVDTAYGPDPICEHPRDAP